MGCLCSRLSSFSLDAVGVVACPSKASFPFTTSTSLSAPHVASETIEVRQGGLLPDFLYHLGPTLGPERTHSDLEFLFLLMKLEIMWKMGVKDSGTRARAGPQRCVEQHCLWNFNHNKVWQENCICTYIQRDCSL